MAQRCKVARKGVAIVEAGQGAEEGQAAGGVRRGHPLEEQAAEQPRQHLDRQEEAGPTGDPALTVRRQTSGGDDAMQVRMVLQRLAPAMQHGDDADLGAEVAG